MTTLESLLGGYEIPEGRDVMSLSDAEIETTLPPGKAKLLKAARDLAKQAMTPRDEKPLLDTPERVAKEMRPVVCGLQNETFFVLLLNTRRRLIKMIKVSDGTLDTILIHPRSVFREAIIRNAAAIILVHNHPSGDPTPSEADVKVTQDLIRAGQLLKIEVLDHVVMGQATTDRLKDHVSLREIGYFEF